MYNKTNFFNNIADAVWQIKQDKSLTLEEKHLAWQEILIAMSDSSFNSYGLYDEANINSIHAFLSKYIDLEKRLLERFYKKEANAVYTYRFWCDGETDWIGENGALYTDFDEAMTEFKDDSDIVPSFAQFSKRYIGKEDKRIHICIRPNGTVLSITED